MLKTGRTHLQDAVPITLGQEFGGYAANVAHAAGDVARASTQLLELNLGATAVGTGLNAGDDYTAARLPTCEAYTGAPVRPATNRFRVTQSMGDVLAFSAALRRLAVEVNKVASDLRLLSSGPRAGHRRDPAAAGAAGIVDHARQGEPVGPRDGQSGLFPGVRLRRRRFSPPRDAGQLELNVMMPVIAWNALHATRILTNAMRVLQERCVAGIRADEERCRELLDRSTALATALSPVHRIRGNRRHRQDVCHRQDDRSGDLVRERKLLPERQLDAILSAGAMTSPGVPGTGEHR